MGLKSMELKEEHRNMIQEKTNECIGRILKVKNLRIINRESWSNVEGRKEDQKDLLSLNLKHKS